MSKVPSPQSSRIFVIGAGIIGVSIAFELRRQGLAVTLLDKKGIAKEASKGNAGAFAFTDITPLATPGIMKKAPKWLLDPLGPLSIPPSYALEIAPWMLRFWRASWKDRFEAAITAQAQLMELSRSALERQVIAAKSQKMLQREGQLQLYEGEREFKASLPDWQRRKDHKTTFKLLESREAIAEIQPGLSPRFTHAGFTPDWINICDPQAWCEHLAAEFCKAGGIIKRGSVRTVQQSQDGMEVITKGESLMADQVIIACGAWSHHLAKQLGDNIPLETERGYNTTLPKGAFDLRTHLSFSNHGFVVSRIKEGVRVGGAAELGGLDLPPNYRRAQILLEKAKTFLPDLNTQNGEQWMGFRPSLPDSLPVIGHASRTNKVIYAFGHGHLGLTQSAGTAELVASLVSGAEPPLCLDAYSPQRF